MQRNMLLALQGEVSVLEEMLQLAINKETKGIRVQTKTLAKECVSATFKMEKKMLSNQEMDQLLQEKFACQARIQELKQMKKDIQS